MAQVRCLDGSSLGVHPVAVRDRGDQPYEFVLRLTRDGQDVGTVGQPAGYFLSSAVREIAGFDGGGVTANGPMFHLRRRDPDDPDGTGELVCAVDVRRRWDGRVRRWVEQRLVVLSAWGEDGIGVRAHLSTEELGSFLTSLLAEAESIA